MKIKIISVFLLILFVVSSGFAYEDPKEAELLFMAKKAYEDGFYEVSLGMLERFKNDFKDSAKSAQVSLLSGQCYFNQGRYLEALNIFEKLLNGPSARFLKDAIYFWIAEVHFKGGNFEKSAAFYQKLIDEYGQSAYCPAAYYSLGWSFSQMGQYKRALEVFKSLLIKYPDEPQSKDAAFKLIECLYNLKNYAQLKDKIVPVFKLYANDALRLPYLYFYLAESEYYLNDFNQAAKDYLKSAQGFKDPKAQALAKLGLGWAYLKLAKYKDAEEAFAVIKQDTLDKKGLDIFVLGQAALMSATNRIYEAKKFYEQLIVNSVDPLIRIQAHLGKAGVFYNLAEYAQATDSYKEALDNINTANAKSGIPEELINKLQHNLGLSYIKQGRIESGVQALESAAAKINDPQEKINLFFQVGDAYASAGEFIKAKGIYLRILKLYPDSPYADYAQYQIGILQFKKTDYNGAINVFELFLKKYPRSKLIPDALYSLAQAYFQKSDYVKSCEIFLRLQNEFKDSPLRPQALYMLGASYLSLGKIEEALNAFKNIPKLYPQDLELLQKAEYEIADCYYKLGQEDEAAVNFKSLRTKYPGSKLTPDILWWLGQYYYRRNDLNLARRYLTSLAQDFSKHYLAANAFYAIGLTFSDENKFQQAGDNFKTAIGLGTAELKVQAALALGDIYIRQGQFQEALTQYKGIIKDNPDLAKTLFPRIASTYYKIGDYENAKSFYLLSLEIADGKETANLRFCLAEVLEAKGEFKAAGQQYFLAAELYEGAPELFSRALLRAAKLYEDREDFAGALRIYNRVIQQGAEEAKFSRERINWIKTNIRN